jgi:hypothetical protein
MFLALIIVPMPGELQMSQTAIWFLLIRGRIAGAALGELHPSD